VAGLDSQFRLGRSRLIRGPSAWQRQGVERQGHLYDLNFRKEGRDCLRGVLLDQSRFPHRLRFAAHGQAPGLWQRLLPLVAAELIVNWGRA
jgi:hypothetical protein